MEAAGRFRKQHCMVVGGRARTVLVLPKRTPRCVRYIAGAVPDDVRVRLVDRARSREDPTVTFGEA